MTSPGSSVSSAATAHGNLSLRSWDGPGQEAILIHGVDGDGGAFDAVASDLGGSRALTAVDLRGRGSSSLDGPWGIGAHAADIISLLEQRGTPVTLVGHSFGGHVASLAAACRPDLVEHLVLVDGGPRRVLPEDKTPLAMAAFVGQTILAKLAEQPNNPLTPVALESDLVSMMTDGSAELVSGGAVTLIRAGHGVAPGLPPIVPDAAVAALNNIAENRAAENRTAENRTALNDIFVSDATHFSLLGEHRAGLVDVLRSA